MRAVEGLGEVSGRNWVAIGLGVIVLLFGGYALGSVLADDDADPTDQAANTETTSPSVTEGSDEPSATGGESVASTPAPVVSGGECDFPPGDPFIEGDATTLEVIGEQDGITVEAAVYPRPDYEGNPWTQWGQGLILSDGRFLSAIGDHLGQDGNSYLYEYDPTGGTLTMIGDVLSYVDHEPGSWGYGKVHGQIVAGPCGEAYFATYWGTRTNLEFSGSYSGDGLFRLDPASRTITLLGVPVTEYGIPSLAGHPSSGLVFGEALDPFTEADIDAGPFFVYDTRSEQVTFTGPADDHVGYRNIMVDGSGRAYYSVGGGQLAVYDPETNEVGTHPATLPGEWLRASTSPTADGRIFGVTNDEDAFFVMHPSGEIDSLGTANGYTASMAVHPDGDRFFYVPEAHGDSWEMGAPLIEVNAETGEQTVLVEMNPMAESLGLRLGGTYSIGVDSTGSRVYIGMNAGDLQGEEDGFGEVVLLVIHLP